MNDLEESLKRQIRQKQSESGRCCGVRADIIQSELDILRQRLAAMQQATKNNA